MPATAAISIEPLSRNKERAQKGRGEGKRWLFRSS